MATSGDQVTQAQVLTAGIVGGVPKSYLPYWAAIVQQESGGHYDAYANSAGAVGPAQKVGYPLPAPGQPLSTWAPGNLLAGAKEFASDINTFQDPSKAIAAYYTGPGNVQKYGVSSSYGSPTPLAYTQSVEAIAKGEPSSLTYPAGTGGGGGFFAGFPTGSGFPSGSQIASGLFGSAPGVVAGAAENAGEAVQNAATGLVNPVLAPFEHAADFFGWITNPKNLIRVGEMIGGGLLIFMGLGLVGFSAAKSAPAQQAAAPAQTAVRVVTRTRTRRAARSRQRASRGAAAPISQQPRRVQRRAGFYPSDARPRRPRRGEPGSSRLGPGDTIPY